MNEMVVLENPAEGVYLVSSAEFVDERGKLLKDFSKDLLLNAGINFEPVERAVIYNRANVMRGIHFQRETPQPKMIHCIEGLIWATALNIKKGSLCMGMHFDFELTAGRVLVTSGDYAIGTLSLTDSIVNIDYGEKFNSEFVCGVRWDDKTISIPWPVDKLQGSIIISDKDCNLPLFSDIF